MGCGNLFIFCGNVIPREFYRKISSKFPHINFFRFFIFIVHTEFDQYLDCGILEPVLTILSFIPSVIEEMLYCIINQSDLSSRQSIKTADNKNNFPSGKTDESCGIIVIRGDFYRFLRNSEIIFGKYKQKYKNYDSLKF